MSKSKIFVALSIFTNLIFVVTLNVEASSNPLFVKPVSPVQFTRKNHSENKEIITVDRTSNTTSKPPVNTRIRFVAPQTNHARRPAGRQRGGANRGGCPATEKPLAAIVPVTTVRDKPGEDTVLTTWESVGGLTTAIAPSFWFYVPNELGKVPKEFVLQDARGNNIYKTSLIASSPGGNFQKIQIPSKAATLKAGEVYRWFFLVNCHPNAPSYVEGWIQRVVLNSSLKSQLQKATLPQQASLYAANGIWYDALTTLASLRRANPSDANLLSSWVNLLNGVGLNEISHEALELGQINANRSKPISQ